MTRASPALVPSVPFVLMAQAHRTLREVLRTDALLALHRDGIRLSAGESNELALLLRKAAAANPLPAPDEGDVA